MSTVLEVAGLAALTVGLFLVLGLGFGLVTGGAAVFLYAQTLDDGQFRQLLVNVTKPRGKK